MREIELPDGSIAEFPDGMSDDQIAGVLRQQFGSPQAPSTIDALAQGQKDVGIGAANAIAGGARGAFPLASRLVELATTGRVGSIMEKPNEAYKAQTADYQSSREAAGETGFDWTRMLGAASSPWNLLSGRLGVTGGNPGAAATIRGGVRAGVAGGGMSGTTDEERAKGAAIGGAAGGVIASVPAVYRAGKDAFSGFTKAGAERKAGEILRESAFDANSAAQNMRSTVPVVPGSAPTAGMASGDEGIASLLNTVQDRVPTVKAAASRASTARETARTTFASRVGGTADDLVAMEAARDQVTRPMREAVLSNVSPIDSTRLTGPIQKLLSVPEMAGKTNQTALSTVLDDLARITRPDGTIDPVALYEVRKDVGLMMNGKFSGDAGNMRFARKALKAVQNAIDDQIDGAGQQPGVWKAYLSEYAGRSKAIDQAATFQDVIRRSGAGTVNPDTGEPILYASKLNNILRREGADLSKKLTNDQIDGLRRLAADLSAEQAAARASRSATGNSVTSTQGNMNAALDMLLGRVPGGGMVSRAAQWAKRGQQDRVMGLLGDAVLDPTRAVGLMDAGAPVITPQLRGLLTGTVSAAVPSLLVGME